MMESAGTFSYADYRREKKVLKAPSETNVEEEEPADEEYTHTYVAMREPDPEKDAQPVALAYFPQQFAYAYTQQPQVSAQQYQQEEQVFTKSSNPVVMAAPVAQPVVSYIQHPVAAYTYGYAMPNYPVPVHSSSPKMVTAAPIVEKQKSPDKQSKVWVGRTKKQVDEDNIKIAVNEGIYKPNDIIPKGAKPDQLFWVVEKDDTHTLRTFQAIDGGSLGKGVWRIDPRYGNAYFVRAKEGKEK